MKRYFRYYVRHFRRFEPYHLEILFSDLLPSDFIKTELKCESIDDPLEPGRLLPLAMKIQLIHEIDKETYEKENKYSVPLLEFHFPDIIKC